MISRLRDSRTAPELLHDWSKCAFQGARKSIRVPEGDGIGVHTGRNFPEKTITGTMPDRYFPGKTILEGCLRRSRPRAGAGDRRIPSATGRLVRGSLLRALGVVSFAVRLERGGTVTFSEFLEELEVLGLNGRTFGPGCCRAALEAYLTIRIEIIVVDDRGDPDTRRAFIEEGHTAVLWYGPEPDLAHVLVLSHH